MEGNFPARWRGPQVEVIVLFAIGALPHRSRLDLLEILGMTDCRIPSSPGERTMTTATEPLSFTQQHFGEVDLGHKARNRCFSKIADLIGRHPGGTLPDKLQSPKDYRAMDRLMNRPEVTHAAIVSAHVERTLEQLRQCDGPVLLVHDTTELDFTGLLSIPELGPIGNGHGRGYLCHNSLAVDPQRHEAIGLVHQILHNRVAVGKKEGVAAKRARASRESRLWTNAIQALEPAPAGKLWVDVADRGADIFEFLAAMDARHYVVRACFNRSIGIGHGATPTKGLLYTFARSLPEKGQRTLVVSSADGERKTTVAVAYAPVQVNPPHVRRGLYEKRPLLVWVVRIWEIAPPAGVKPLEWVLLTNVAVDTVAAAWERMSWYKGRWVIEEYHKAQKTGCGIETLQFTTEAALQPMIALLSVVAVTLLNLRRASRQEDATTRPAQEVIHPDYVAVLSAWRYKGELRMEMSVHDFFYALARLGGHQNRKSDHRPGWLILWRGWMKLQNMADGAEVIGSSGYKFRGQS
jgi:hypothetical protein